MAEEKGIVNENLEAVLMVKFSNQSKIECVLDTGFNGSLLLPRKFVENNSMLFIGPEQVDLVEGISTEIDTALAEVDWLGDSFSIRIFVSETNEALIGVEMLIDSVLEIDYRTSIVKITK
jgi:clan AA aspartic protease